MARHGFSMIEMVGVLAVIAILAATLIPTVIRRVDQGTLTREIADLQTMSDAFTQYVVRNKTVPDQNNLASDIGNQLSLPVSAITTNSRRFARAFLIDPNLSIDGLPLPYTQTNNGATNVTDARVMILSSLSSALPANMTPDFNNIWNAAEGTVPAGSAFSGWAGKGDDLRIKKLNVQPQFYQLILINHDTVTPGFSIDGSSVVPVPNTGAWNPGWNKYYLDSTVVALTDTNGVTQVRYLLKRNISFVFESGAWRGQIEGGHSFNPASLYFLERATAFVNEPLNSQTQQGASQFSVLVVMYNFLQGYTLWANECPYHFNNRGTTVTQIPEYNLLDVLAGNAASSLLNQYASDKGLLNH